MDGPQRHPDDRGPGLDVQAQGRRGRDVVHDRADGPDRPRGRLGGAPAPEVLQGRQALPAVRGHLADPAPGHPADADRRAPQGSRGGGGGRGPGEWGWGRQRRGRGACRGDRLRTTIIEEGPGPCGWTRCDEKCIYTKRFSSHPDDRPAPRPVAALDERRSGTSRLTWRAPCPRSPLRTASRSTSIARSATASATV